MPGTRPRDETPGDEAARLAQGPSSFRQVPSGALGIVVAFVLRVTNPPTSTAADIMRSDVAVAAPTWSIAELERQLCSTKVSGFPVVERGRLIGVVSRSDVIRQLAVEHSRAGEISDYFRRDDAHPSEMERSILDEERFVGARLARLHVSDVMSPATFIATPEMKVPELARLLIEHRIHRVPVTEGDHLVGIVSSLDLVRLIAEGASEASQRMPP